MAEGFWAKALFDYKAVESTELSVTKGDVVFVEEQNDSGWCLAKRGEESGWLPTDYVEKTDEAPSGGGAGEAAVPEPVPEPIPEPIPDEPVPEPVPEPAPVRATVSGGGSYGGSSGGSSGGTTSGSSGGGKLCHKCGTKVDSAFVSAKDKTFHAKCFTCIRCNQSLGGKAFIEKDGKFYCEDDYYTEFNPRCGYCNEIIKGQYISALGQSWHPDHFVCTECGKPFEGNQFHKSNDKPYCEKHYNELFAENCFTCGQKIEGQVFEALERKFHLECFVCSVGDHQIGEGVNFHLHNDKVFCPTHFEELFLQKCAGCGSIIKGQYVKVLDAHFHPGCWKCADCGVVINSDNCGQAGGKFYCKSCVGKKVGGGAVSSPTSSSTSTRPAAGTTTRKPETKETKSYSGSSGSGGGGPGATFYSYDALKGDSLPSGVDKNTKELYLADDVFLDMFKMDKATFSKLPEWKKKRLKQKVGLF